MEANARAVLVSEARELLADMERALLGLEASAGSTELVHAAFRAAHTIKGAAGLFDLTLITSFTQILENVLERVRAGALTVDEKFVSMLLQCCDYLGSLVTAIERETEHVDPDPDLRESLLGALGELSDDRSSARARVTALARAPDGAAPRACGHWHISLRFRPNVLKNGLDPLAFIVHLRTLGTLIYVQTYTEAIPPIPQFDPELCYLGFEVGLKTPADRAAIEGVFELVRDDCELRLLAPQSNAAEYIQVIHGLSSSRRRVGELLVVSGALTQAELDSALQAQAAAAEGHQPRLGEVLLSQQLVAAPVIAAALNKQKQGEERRSMEQRLVKVDASKLDQLINLIGELVIASEGARVTAGRAHQPDLVEAMGRVGPED